MKIFSRNIISLCLLLVVIFMSVGSAAAAIRMVDIYDTTSPEYWQFTDLSDTAEETASPEYMQFTDLSDTAEVTEATEAVDSPSLTL